MLSCTFVWSQKFTIVVHDYCFIYSIYDSKIIILAVHALGLKKNGFHPSGFIRRINFLQKKNCEKCRYKISSREIQVNPISLSNIHLYITNMVWLDIGTISSAAFILIFDIYEMKRKIVKKPSDEQSKFKHHKWNHRTFMEIKCSESNEYQISLHSHKNLLNSDIR